MEISATSLAGGKLITEGSRGRGAFRSSQAHSPSFLGIFSVSPAVAPHYSTTPGSTCTTIRGFSAELSRCSPKPSNPHCTLSPVSDLEPTLCRVYLPNFYLVTSYTQLNIVKQLVEPVYAWGLGEYICLASVGEIRRYSARTPKIQ